VNGDMPSSYYRQMHVAIIVFDCTNGSSIDRAVKEISNVRKFCNDDILIALVANKIDLKRTVSTVEGKSVARRNNVPLYFETTITSSESVNTVIEKCAEAMLMIDDGKYCFEKLCNYVMHADVQEYVICRLRDGRMSDILIKCQ
jgi:GTPase SAR1 family protein